MILTDLGGRGRLPAALITLVLGLVYTSLLLVVFPTNMMRVLIREI